MNGKIIACFFVMLLLAGCAWSTPSAIVLNLTPSATPTLIPEATYSPHCLGTQVTRYFPTSTPQATLDTGPNLKSTSIITPELSMAPPPGIVYRTWSGLWIVTEKGRSRLAVMYNLGLRNAKLCSTGESILVDKNGETTHKYVIWDFLTGKTVNITARPDEYFCSVDWLGNRCDALLVYPMLISDTHSGCWSYPVIFDLNGNRNIIGTSSSSPYYDAAVSPDDEYIAYNDRGHPVLYKWGNGSIPINFDQEVFPGCGFSFVNPSWSGDSNKIAWEVTGYINGSRIGGIAIYDLRSKTSMFLYPYTMEDFGYPNIIWNPKQDTMQIRTYHNETTGLTVIKSDGTPVFYLDDVILGDWSPDGEWLSYGVHGSTGYKENVISSDGKELHALSPGWSILAVNNFIDWSPDSRYLIYKDHEGYVLVKTGEWVPYRLQLPRDAKIMDWANQAP